MRIIAQDKTTDIPYEKSALIVEKVNENVFNILGFLSGRYFWLGSYKDMNDAKAVLWKIASSFRECKTYFNMPQADEDLTYPYREL
jgi:hypothetical protein